MLSRQPGNLQAKPAIDINQFAFSHHALAVAQGGITWRYAAHFEDGTGVQPPQLGKRQAQFTATQRQVQCQRVEARGYLLLFLLFLLVVIRFGLCIVGLVVRLGPLLLVLLVSRFIVVVVETFDIILIQIFSTHGGCAPRG